MQRVLVLLFVALSVEAANAQDDRREPSSALKAAMTVSAAVEGKLKRLNLCAELDTRNSATYIFVAAEYLRDKAVGDAITKADHLIDAELQSVPGGAEKAKAIRQQLNEEMYQKRRQEALRATAEFQQDCRRLARDFLLREGSFRSLHAIFPKEMREIDIRYAWEPALRCFNEGDCRR